MARPVAIAIDSVPAGSRVLLEGKELGVAPFKTELPPSDHELAFVARRAGFKDASVALPGGQGGSRVVTLEKGPPGERDAGNPTAHRPRRDKKPPPDKKLNGDDSVNPFGK